MMKSVLMFSISDLAEMMNDFELIVEMEEGLMTTCAFPVPVSNLAYDADDMTPEARISRWLYENTGLNNTTVYVEVEA